MMSRSALRAVTEFGHWAVGRRERFRVVGDSMEPSLSDGDFVLVDPSARPDLDDMVVADHPQEHGLRVVKRIGEITDDGRFVLVSDNPERGTDSRSWGPVAPTSVLGQVTIVLDRPLSSRLGNRSPWTSWMRR